MDTKTPGLPLSALRWLNQEAQYLRARAPEARRQGPSSSPTIGQGCDLRQHSLTAVCLGGPVRTAGGGHAAYSKAPRGDRERGRVWVRCSAPCPVHATGPGSVGHGYRKTGAGGRVWPDARLASTWPPRAAPCSEDHYT